MQMARGVGALEALQEQLKPGATVTKIQVELLDNALFRIKTNLGLQKNGGPIVC